MALAALVIMSRIVVVVAFFAFVVAIGFQIAEVYAIQQRHAAIVRSWGR